MGVVRTKSLVSTIYTYIGFLFGAANIFLFLKYVEPGQYGLTRSLFDICALFTSLASFSIPTLMARFYPYYKELPERKNDLLTIAFIITGIGFLLILGANWFLEPVIIRKFSAKSPLLVKYFDVAFLLTFFFLGFQLLEVHAWFHQQIILSNFLKEVAFKAYNLIILVIFVLGMITFHAYIWLFGLTYAVTFGGLFIYFVYKRQLPMVRPPSEVTKRLWKQMLPFTLFVFGSNIITTISLTIDTILISSFQGLAYAGVYALANYISTVIEVPQRSMISIGVPIISQSWKDNDMRNIENIYAKSSITLLIFSSFIFTIAWLNLDDAFNFLKLDPVYWEGKQLILLLGLTKIIEMGTGLNSQIISTSSRWKFELYSHLVLLAMTLPLNYFLVKSHGLYGAGIATLASVSVYNAIRFIYLWKKFGLQPYNRKTIYAVLLVASLYYGVDWLIRIPVLLVDIAVRTLVFSGLYIFLVIRLNLSEDITTLYKNGLGRLNRMLGRY